jgi:hypothetical protein
MQYSFMAHTPLALLGVLGLIQVVFLPGYLLLRALRIRSGFIAAAVLSFALSLLANYLLVVVLGVLGLYRPIAMYAVFAAELALWLRIDYRWLSSRLDRAIVDVRERTRSFFDDIDCHCPVQSRWLRRALIVSAAAVIAGFAVAGIAEMGRIFHQWDAVVSWNRWAVDWADNRLPQVTSYYPQLLPANISVSYVFMRSSQVWIFAKSMQFLFCLMLLLAMLDAARWGTVPVFADHVAGKPIAQTRRWAKMGLSPSTPDNCGLLPGIVITYGLFVALLRYRMLSSGYADVPLAMFAWMPIYALIRADSAADNSQRWKWLILGALFAAGAALTKQMGLYVAAIYPLLAVARLRRAGLAAASSLRLWLLIGIFVAPWYAYKYADIRSGQDENNTPKLLQDFHEGRTVPERLVHAAAAVLEATSWPGGILLGIALIVSLQDRRAQWLLGLFVVPLGLLWAAAFSYDLRNLAMLLPFVGMAAGIGLVRIIVWAEGNSGRVQIGASLSLSPSPRLSDSASWLATLRAGHAVALIATLVIVAAFCVSNESLLASQQRQQRNAGIISLNEKLYAHAAAHPGTGLIAGDYQAMCWLPELAARSVGCECRDLAAFRQTFHRADVRYILVRSAGAAEEVRAFLAKPAVARLLFEDHGFAFYEKRR